MRGTIIQQAFELLKRVIRQKRWRRVMTLAAGLVVFATTYAMILPAITSSEPHPYLRAELTKAEAGEGLEVEVYAAAPDLREETCFVLTAIGDQAGISEDYVFDERGKTLLFSEDGKEVRLQRSGRSDGSGEIDYWFTLSAGEELSFRLKLSDRIDPVELLRVRDMGTFMTLRDPEEATSSDASRRRTGTKEQSRNQAKTSGATPKISGATASDASHREPKMTAKEETVSHGRVVRLEEQEAEKLKAREIEKRASASDASARRTSGAEMRASGIAKRSSDAGVQKAAKPLTGEKSGSIKASGSDAAGRRGTDAGGSDTGELLDGELINDLELPEPEEEREITASLILSAGSGGDLAEALRDADRNAEKRGNARIRFLWLGEISDSFQKTWIGDDLTVTVQYGEEAEIPEEALLSVTEMEEEEEDYRAYFEEFRERLLRDPAYTKALPVLPEEEGNVDISGLRLFDISLLTEDGEELEPAAPIRVMIRSESGFGDEADQAVDVVHFHPEGTELLYTGEVTGSGDGNASGAVSELLFETGSFSPFGIGTLRAAPAAKSPGETPAEVMYIGSVSSPGILSGRSFETDNSWQIAAQGLPEEGETAEYRYSDDGLVRVRKHVIPTDTENLFQVYLSIDYQQKAAWKTFFEIADYLATTSANFQGQAGTVVDSMTGNRNVKVSAVRYSDHTNKARFQIYDSKGNFLTEQVLYWGQNGSSGKPNNFTIYIELGPSEYFVVGAKLSKDLNSENTLVRLELTEKSEKLLTEYLSRQIILNRVTDRMGEFILNLSSVSQLEGDVGEGTTASQKEIVWIPVLKENPETEESLSVNGNITTRTIWYKNVSELIYQARLCVTQEGFVSAGDTVNAVNEEATLTYNGNAAVSFPVPEVRGVLYEAAIYKTGEGISGAALPGASFQITQLSGDPGFPTEGKTVVSDDQGRVLFTDLPWGTYRVEEISAPSGYGMPKAPAASAWEIRLCYTDLPSLADPDQPLEESGGKLRLKRNISLDTDPSAATELAGLIPEGTSFVVTDPKTPYRVRLSKVDQGTRVLSGAILSVTDSRGEQILSEELREQIRMSGSADLPDGSIQTGAVYTISESLAPAGFNRLETPLSFRIDADSTAEGGYRLRKADGGEWDSSFLRLQVTSEQEGTIHEARVLELRLKNDEGIVLPHTGGPGTGEFLFAGLMALTAVPVILLLTAGRDGPT